jgi:signal transduction histidine kinase
VNLVRNAVEAVRSAAPGGADGGGPGAGAHDEARRGHVVVRSERRGDGVSIVVEDDGPGVPEGSRDRVFDPYVTTKQEGTGLGLAIVKKIVVEHNGWITVGKSERLGGAAFVVGLPFAPPAPAGSAPGGDADRAPPSAPRA